MCVCVYLCVFVYVCVFVCICVCVQLQAALAIVAVICLASPVDACMTCSAGKARLGTLLHKYSGAV